MFRIIPFQFSSFVEEAREKDEVGVKNVTEQVTEDEKENNRFYLSPVRFQAL